MDRLRPHRGLAGMVHLEVPAHRSACGDSDSGGHCPRDDPSPLGITLSGTAALPWKRRLRVMQSVPIRAQATVSAGRTRARTQM